MNYFNNNEYAAYISTLNYFRIEREQRVDDEMRMRIHKNLIMFMVLLIFSMLNVKITIISSAETIIGAYANEKEMSNNINYIDWNSKTLRNKYQ